MYIALLVAIPQSPRNFFLYLARVKKTVTFSDQSFIKEESLYVFIFSEIFALTSNSLPICNPLTSPSITNDADCEFDCIIKALLATVTDVTIKQFFQSIVFLCVSNCCSKLDVSTIDLTLQSMAAK